MQPDLKNAKQFRNIQLGKHIVIPQLFLLADGNMLFTLVGPMTPAIDAYIRDYIVKEYLDVPKESENNSK